MTEQSENDIKNHYSWLLDQYKVALDASNIVSITDDLGKIEYVNEKFCKISGYSKEELLGKSHNIVRHPEMEKATFKDLWSVIKKGKIWKGIVKNLKKDGTTYIVNTTIIPIKDEKGAIKHYIGIRHDITNIVEKDQLIERQSIDFLTQLPNKVKLIEDMEDIDFPILSVVNIDGFSEINDFYGLDIGDEILIDTARLIENFIDKEKHSVYRLYGDEFAVLTKTKLDQNHHLETIGALLVEIRKEPFICGEQKIYISLTSGTAFESETIIGKANLALRHAKREKKFHQVFDENMLASYKHGENIEWANRIRDAIKEDRIVPFFQPIMNLKTGEITKYEALVRLIDSDGVIISPAQFLTIAKKSKQYSYVTKKMLESAITIASKHNIDISVNLSIEDIESSEIVDFIDKTLAKHSVGDKIIFEITETEDAQNYLALRNFIDLVKSKYHSKVAIDDFGSGYSNFEHILELDFDFLKIDGSIISKINNSKQSMVLLDAIIAFTEKLGIKTIAEFVSSEEILEAVKNKGIDFGQGFFIGKPLDHLLTEIE